ncbi:MAG: hypothetical protein EON48_13995 [Acetobacteraceae bacterium]|nr:MAG: hypothetical protein EON48_13995 [Acetobacteraceae bacterium]
MSGGAKLQVRVAEVVEVNELIRRFRFVSRDGSLLPAFSGGAHTVVEMDDHGLRRLNPYSLMSDPEDRSGYEISVRRDEAGRGDGLTNSTIGCGAQGLRVRRCRYRAGSR